MAPDGSWQNDAPPPRRQGLSVFGKVLIGCGAAFLCFLLAIGGLTWLVVGKASKAMDQGWAQIRGEVALLRTDAGARRLYRDNPGLAQNYATEDEFVKASAAWRDKVGDLPEQRPAFKELFAGGKLRDFNIRTREAEGRKTVTVRLRLSTGAMLHVELENDKLVDIQVD